MQRELAKDIPEGKHRVAFLLDNCDKAEDKGYMKRFTPEQLNQMKEQLSETAIEINDIEVEKKEVMDGFKDRLKPLVEEKGRLLTGLKNKSEYVNERCFKFIDLENREVGYYNEDGDLIESRPVYADELQGNLFKLPATGTND
jgi:hypothetical protein